jgi:ATP-dependent protease ClpP protease subunit
MMHIEHFTFNAFQERSILAWDDNGFCAFIDPGFADAGERDRLTAFVADKGLKPVCIMLTHAHLDHIFGVAELAELYSIPVYMDAREKYTLEVTNPFLCKAFGLDEQMTLTLIPKSVTGPFAVAISEMIAGMKKPTVSLVLGGGHSIGIPLAVCTKKSFITPTASMTVHPVRMSGLVVGAPQTFRYFQRIQEQIADFVTANSGISKEQFERYMMATGEMATDVGTILYGKEAVSSGLIDKLGGLNDALSALHRMIDKHKNKMKSE